MEIVALQALATAGTIALAVATLGASTRQLICNTQRIRAKFGVQSTRTAVAVAAAGKDQSQRQTNNHQPHCRPSKQHRKHRETLAWQPVLVTDSNPKRSEWFTRNGPS